MADDVRWITLACADRFFDCDTAQDAFNSAKYKRLIKEFTSQNPATWYTEGAGSDGGLRSRHAGLGDKQPSPGSRPIGSLKANSPAHRAWVWQDDWSIIGGDLGKPYHWMIAAGKRVKDSPRHDLQEVAKDILHSTTDSWRPTLWDYQQLAAALTEADRERDIDNIHAARREAHENLNTVIPVTLQDHAAEIAEAHVGDDDDDDEHQGVIVESFTVRYFIVSLHYKDGSTVPSKVLEDLADFAFDDLPVGSYETCNETGTWIEDLVIDPNTSICYVAPLD